MKFDYFFYFSRLEPVISSVTTERLDFFKSVIASYGFHLNGPPFRISSKELNKLERRHYTIQDLYLGAKRLSFRTVQWEVRQKLMASDPVGSSLPWLRFPPSWGHES